MRSRFSFAAMLRAGAKYEQLKSPQLTGFLFSASGHEEGDARSGSRAIGGAGYPPKENPPGPGRCADGFFSRACRTERTAGSPQPYASGGDHRSGQVLIERPRCCDEFEPVGSQMGATQVYSWSDCRAHVDCGPPNSNKAGYATINSHMSSPVNRRH